MATGAKPLLMQLRETLESICQKDPKSYIKNPDYKFCDSNAETVHEILSLYNDRNATPFGELITKGQNAIKTFQKNEETLFPQGKNNRPTDHLDTIWNNYKKSFRPKIREALDCNKNKSCENDILGDNKLRAQFDLAIAYKGFINGDVKSTKYKGMKLRGIKGVFKAQKSLEQQLHWKDDLKTINLLEETNDPSITSHYKTLRDHPGLIRLHADQIFVDKDYTKPMKSEFVHRVQQAAQSFFNTIDATRELLEVSLKLASRLSVSTDFNKRYLEKAVDVSTELINSRYLERSLNLLKKDKNSAFSDLHAAIEKIRSLKTPNSTLKEALAELLVNKNNISGQTHRYAFTLIELNKSYINKANKENQVPLLGISNGPIEGIEPFQTAAEISKTLNKDLSGALARGRLDKGLDTLIEEYLKEAHSYPKNTDKLEDKQQQLFDVLARFAQKVLFIANNQSLFSDSTCATFFSSEQGCSQTNYKANGQINKYIQVLQAVGNSILFQVDELRIQNKYDDKLKKNGPNEAYALKQALPNYSELVLIKLIEGLEKDFQVSKNNFEVYKTLENAQNTVQAATNDLAAKINAHKVAKKEHADAVPIEAKWKKIYNYLKTKVSVAPKGGLKDRTLTVTLINKPTGAKLDSLRNIHTHLVTNKPPVVFFPVDKSEGSESDSPVIITVALSHKAATDVTVDISLPTTVRSSLNKKTVTIKKGETQADVTLSITNNTAKDGNTTETLTLQNSKGAQLGSGSFKTVYMHTIKDDDGPPVVSFEASSSYGRENESPKTFTVKLSKKSDKKITVPFRLTGAAQNDAAKEYLISTQNIEIQAGDTEGSVQASIFDNAIDAPNKSFTLTLGNPNNGAVLGALKNHTYTIINNDGVPTVFFHTGQSKPREKIDGTLIIQVALSHASGKDINVDYTVTDKSAKNGKDFELQAGTLTFKAGTTHPESALKADINNNNEADGNRDFIIALTTISQGTSSLGHIREHTASILDDDKPLPKIGFKSVATRSPRGLASRSIQVTLNAKATQNITQDYSITETTNGKTVVHKSSTLIIGKGGEFATISLDITDATPKEVIVETADPIDFSPMVNAITAEVEKISTVLGSDEWLLSKNLSKITEQQDHPNKSQQGSFKKVLLATQEKFENVAEDLTNKKTAEAVAKDAEENSQKGKNEILQKKVDFLDALKKKNAAEVTRNNKLEFIRFLNERNLEIDKPQVVQGQVVQFLEKKLKGISAPPPPSLPSIGFESTSSRNLESETSPTLNVKLSKAGQSTITVKYKAEGPATNGAGKDFQLNEGTLVFQKGVESLPIPGLQITNDSSDNGDRTFILKLSDPTGATHGSNKEHIYRIIDDDGVPSIYFDVVKSEIKEDITPAIIKVRISNSPATDVTVDYKFDITKNNTAIKDSDFVLADGTLTFSKTKNELKKNITIVVNNDTTKEGDETLALNLSNPSANAKLGADHMGHTLAIKANDGGETPAATVSASTRITNDEKKKLNDAIERVQVRLPQMEYPLPPTPPNLDTKQVMDQLIDTLKYQHIAAVREGGQASGQVKYLEDALNAARNHRADMVAIRPAFAYLRNSFPTTSLQNDADLGWKNLLSDRMHRSIFGECLDCEEKSRRTITKEIDKQYWQNINRIRVSGGGNTNYVIAKDDIGNWTVKNFSADPAPIIESAKNMALFSMGGAMGQDLIAAGNPPTDAQGNPIPPQPGTPQTVLEKQIATFKKEYEKSSESDLKNAKSAMQGLQAQILTKWKSDEKTQAKATEFGGFIEDATTKMDAVAQDGTTEPVENKIQRRLKAIITFQTEAKAALTKNLDVATETAAIGILTKTVQGVNSRLLLGRQNTVFTYETAITVLSQSVTNN
jgi:hypothetical protein